MTLRVWFELERPACVFLPDDAIIAEFCDAVKILCPNRLKYVYPCNLIVYKNTSAYESRVTPLDEHLKVFGLGQTVKVRLIVKYGR